MVLQYQFKGQVTQTFPQFQPFVPPPHFRRWVQRFMKRWHNRNAPEGCMGFDGKESTGDTQEEVPKCDEETQQGDEETTRNYY